MMRISHLITAQNEDWWKYCESVFNIKIQQKEIHTIKVIIAEKDITILIPRNGCPVEIFSFELLRIFLLSKQIYITDYMIACIAETPLLNWTFRENFFSWAGFQLETIKVLPMLGQSGMISRELREHICWPELSAYQMSQIEASLGTDTPSVHATGLFIKQFFCLRVDQMIGLNTNFSVTELKKIRPDLFTILDSFANNWINFPIGLGGVFEPSYKTFTRNFIHTLGYWTIHHIHTSKKCQN